MSGTQETHRSGTRAGVVALVAIVGALFVLPSAASAQSGPWPYAGQNVFGFRASSDGPRTPSLTSLRERWRRDLDAAVTGTPIVASTGGVYFGTWAGEVFAVQYQSGKTAWAVGAAFVGGPVVGSPLFALDTIFVAASKTGSPRLVALDPLTGQQRFSTIVDTQRDADIWGSPTYSVDENLVYVPICACSAELNRKPGVALRGAVVAVDAMTGEIRWRRETVPQGNGGAVAGTPVVIDVEDRLYVATDHAFSGTAHANTDSILALDTGSGAIVGSYQARADDSSSASDLTPTAKTGFQSGPLAFVDKGEQGTQILVGAGAKDGSFHAVEHLFGLNSEPAWKQVVGLGSQFGGIVGASAWDSAALKLYGTASTPTTYWGVNTNGTGGSPAFIFPGTDGIHHGPVTYGRNYIWSSSTAGFIDIQDARNAGRIVHRLPLGLPSQGGISFGFGHAFAAGGSIALPDRGAVVAYK